MINFGVKVNNVAQCDHLPLRSFSKFQVTFLKKRKSQRTRKCQTTKIVRFTGRYVSTGLFVDKVF